AASQKKDRSRPEAGPSDQLEGGAGREGEAPSGEVSAGGPPPPPGGGGGPPGGPARGEEGRRGAARGPRGPPPGGRGACRPAGRDGRRRPQAREPLPSGASSPGGSAAEAAFDPGHPGSP